MRYLTNNRENDGKEMCVGVLLRTYVFAVELVDPVLESVADSPFLAE